MMSILGGMLIYNELGAITPGAAVVFGFGIVRHQPSPPLHPHTTQPLTSHTL